MEILLIRHGATPHGVAEPIDPLKGVPNPDLSEKGLRQAHKLAQRLANSGIQAIYASDMRRASHTAEILGEQTGCAVEIRPGLREINMGRLFTTTWEEIQKEDPQFAQAWLSHAQDLAYPEGENGQDLLRRTLQVVEEIVLSELHKVAVVTHGGNIRSLVCWVLGVGQEKRFLIGDPLENCSISSLKVDPLRSTFTVHSLNDTSHL